MQIFHIRINGGKKKELEIKSGIYKSVVAAIPALFDLDTYPLRVEIWAPDLVPKYGPYFYIITEPGGRVEQEMR